MKTLHITYPYGMNSKAGDETITKKDKLIGSKFLSLKDNYPQTPGNKHVYIYIISVKNILCNINAHLIRKVVNSMNFI